MERFLTQAMIVCFILGSSRVAAQRCNELHPVTSPFNESAWLSCIDGVEPVVSASTPDALYDLLSNLGAADVTVVITGMHAMAVVVMGPCLLGAASLPGAPPRSAPRCPAAAPSPPLLPHPPQLT